MTQRTISFGIVVLSRNNKEQKYRQELQAAVRNDVQLPGAAVFLWSPNPLKFGRSQRQGERHETVWIC